MIQILHRGSCTSGHWFTFSTLECPKAPENVFDSVYTNLDQEGKSQALGIIEV